MRTTSPVQSGGQQADPPRPAAAGRPRPSGGCEADGVFSSGGPAISPEDVAKFQRLCKDVYGMDLTLEEAAVKGGRLLELFRVLVNPQR